MRVLDRCALFAASRRMRERMTRLATPVLLGVALLVAGTLRADIQCHPTTPVNRQARTSMKHRTAPALTVSAKQTSVAGMLAWPAPAHAADAAVRSSQSPIDPRENDVFTLTGDLWRVKVEDNDCDFHMELSAPGTGKTAPRVIVEVPQSSANAGLRNAIIAAVKAAGMGDLSTTPNLNFAQPLPISVTGLAFWDGTHWSSSDPQKGKGHGTPVVGTLWELHPVTSAQLTASPGAADTLAAHHRPGLATTTNTDTTSTDTARTDTTKTETTATNTTTSTPPAPPADKTPPGSVWYVKVTAPFNGTTQVVTVLRDPHADPSATPSALKVADDVRLTPAFSRLTAGRLVYMRINKDTITRIEQLPTDPRRRTWTMLIIGAVLLFLLYLGKPLLRGKDGPYSKSQVQAAVWFAVLVLAYVSTNIMRSQVAGTSLFGLVNIPAHLALLSGISLFTFGAAKGIRVAQEKNAASIPAAAPLPPPKPGQAHFPRDLFIDADGHPDLGDVQMLLLTLLAVVVYVVQVWSWQENIPVFSPATLPDVDTTILAAMGLGQGAYLLKKQVGQ